MCKRDRPTAYCLLLRDQWVLLVCQDGQKGKFRLWGPHNHITNSLGRTADVLVHSWHQKSIFLIVTARRPHNANCDSLQPLLLILTASRLYLLPFVQTILLFSKLADHSTTVGATPKRPILLIVTDIIISYFWWRPPEIIFLDDDQKATSIPVTAGRPCR